MKLQKADFRVDPLIVNFLNYPFCNIWYHLEIKSTQVIFVKMWFGNLIERYPVEWNILKSRTIHFLTKANIYRLNFEVSQRYKNWKVRISKNI